MPKTQPPTDPRQERDFESLLEDAEVKDFLHRFETEALPNIKQSGMVLSILSGDPDAKLCLEMGAALLFDKPIVLLVLKGRSIPGSLRRVACLNHALVMGAIAGMQYEAQRRAPSA